MPIQNNFSQLQQLYARVSNEPLTDKKDKLNLKQERASVQEAFIKAYFDGDGSKAGDQKIKNKINSFKSDSKSILDAIESGQRKVDKKVLSELQAKALKHMPGPEMLRKPYEKSTDDVVHSRYCSQPIREGYGLVHISNKVGSKHADMFIETSSKQQDGNWNRHSLIHSTFGIAFPTGNPTDFNPTTEFFKNQTRTAQLDVKESIFNADTGDFCNVQGSVTEAVTYADRQLLSGNDFITIELPIAEISKMTDYLMGDKHIKDTKAGLPIYQMLEGESTRSELEALRDSSDIELNNIEKLVSPSLEKLSEGINNCKTISDIKELKKELDEINLKIEGMKGNSEVIARLVNAINNIKRHIVSLTKPTDFQKLMDLLKSEVDCSNKEIEPMKYYFRALREQADNKISKIDFKNTMDQYIQHASELASYFPSCMKSDSESDGFIFVEKSDITTERLFIDGKSCIPEEALKNMEIKEKAEKLEKIRLELFRLNVSKMDGYIGKTDDQERFTKKRSRVIERNANNVRGDIKGISTERVNGEWRAASVNCAGLCLRMLQKFSDIKMQGANMFLIGASSPQNLAQGASPVGFKRVVDSGNRAYQEMPTGVSERSRFFQKA
ncbi:hypothetical protein [Dongshaea marina]|uniref:hypothetical protein n=1 Tax=Dongshaea marina TaxID=2047966 RepID=UPI000D3E5B9C|nr:hypothetical protein [Dongshaea marina]